MSVPGSRVGMRAAALAVLLAASFTAQAGLFDDEEARKAIVELRARVAAIDEENKGRIAEVADTKAQILEQLSLLRRSLLDLNNQIEGVRGEMAKLRGDNEQMLRDVAELQKRQTDISQALDDRVRALEPTKVSLDGSEFLVTTAEKAAYDAAVASLRTGDFDRSAVTLNDFLRRYPQSGYVQSVNFWLGNALYGKRDYKEAVNAFRSFVAAAPQHPRAPEALLALANSQAEMKDPRSARRTLEDLVKKYPGTEAAQAGKERLASIK